MYGKYLKKILLRFSILFFILFFAVNAFFTAPVQAVKINGKCGPANGNTYANYSAFEDAGTCNPGIFQLLNVEFGSTKDKWLWSCVGEEDGASVTDCYAFIEKSEETGYCGDGIVDLAEECDDGNTNNNDSCSNNCKINDDDKIGTSTKIIEYDNPLKTDSIIDIVKRIADYFYYVAIAIVPIIMIYAAVLLLTAGGNDQQVTKAKKTFIWLVIGIAILLIGSGVITLLKDILNTG